VIRAIAILLAVLGAGGAIVFVALYLGGYPAAFQNERLALAPLMGGLGAGVLEGYRRGTLQKRTAVIGMLLLAVWAVFLRVRP
jgi:hypothetical protein